MSSSYSCQKDGEEDFAYGMSRKSSDGDEDKQMLD